MLQQKSNSLWRIRPKGLALSAFGLSFLTYVRIIYPLVAHILKANEDYRFSHPVIFYHNNSSDCENRTIVGQ